MDKWIKEFTSDEIHSRKFQCGSITPILFCIDDRFPVINNTVIRTYNDFSVNFGWNDIMYRKLVSYPSNIEKCKKLISSLGIQELDNFTLFDTFCHWYDRISELRIQDSAREEAEGEDDEASYKADEKIRIMELDFPSFLGGLNLDNISKFEPHSLRNPERVKINQIIQNCSKGIWVLPNFQRYYSWRKNHVKEFLESIFNDYYVGSLLFWDAAKELQLDIMPIKGSEVKKDELDPSLIILDGQQRITSLYYAIKAPGFHLEGTKSPVYFYINFHSFFNPETDGEIIEILNRKLSNEESFRRMLFPFYQLDEFNKWTYEFEDFMLKTSRENYDKIRNVRSLIERKLWHIREGFEIPYISLPESMDVGQITDIFERTNTMGIKLNAFDLLIARLSKHDIELRKIWEEVIKRYPKLENYQKYNEKMPQYILQAISLFYDKNSACKRDDILNIYPRIFELSNMDFEEIWYEVSDSMNKAIHKLENLRDGFGVKDESQLPFSPTLPILAALIKELGTRNNKISCNTKISIWYWSSVFSNAYSGAVDSQLTSDFREMRTWFSDDSKIPRTVERARREMMSLNLRDVRTKGSALFKGVLSILALEGAKDFDTKQVLENAPYNDRDHIFPVAEFVSERDLNSVLNMTWMSGETNRHIKGYKKPSIYTQKFIDDKYGGNESQFLEMLKTHMINSTAYNFMKKDDFEGFITERQKLIIAKIYSLLGLEYADHDTEVGDAALISPDTPFSNKMIIWNTIESCRDYIYWVDKYFSAEGLQLLIGSIEEEKIETIKILTSLARIDHKFRRLFQDFRIEILKKKNINCELRIMNSRLGSNIHDRWIISKDISFNLPSPDVIARGQFSEVKRTSNRPPFEKWWDDSLDIITKWNEIETLLNKK